MSLATDIVGAVSAAAVGVLVIIGLVALSQNNKSNCDTPSSGWSSGPTVVQVSPPPVVAVPFPSGLSPRPPGTPVPPPPGLSPRPYGA